MADDTLDPDNKVSLVQLCLGGSQGLAQFFTTDQISQVLSKQPTVTLAAAILVDSLIARFSISVDFKSGATSYQASQKFAHLQDLADRLRKSPGDFPGGDDGTGVPNVELWMGGQSESEMRSYKNDMDLVQPNFAIGQFDDYTSGEYSDREDDC